MKKGAVTISLMTISIMTFTITTLSATILIAMTLAIKTLSTIVKLVKARRCNFAHLAEDH